MVIPPHDRVPCFESLQPLRLLHYSQWFVRCRSVKDLVKKRFNQSELCFWKIYCNCLAVKLVHSVHAGKDHFTLVRPRLHPQVKVGHEASKVTCLVVSFPAPWDEVTDSLRLFVHWLRCDILKCCVDAAQHVDSAVDWSCDFNSQLLHRICYFLSHLLLKCCEVCCGDHVRSQVCWVCGCCCRRPTLELGDFRELPLVASLSDAPHDKLNSVL